MLLTIPLIPVAIRTVIWCTISRINYWKVWRVWEWRRRTSVRNCAIATHFFSIFEPERKGCNCQKGSSQSYLCDLTQPQLSRFYFTSALLGVGISQWAFIQVHIMWQHLNTGLNGRCRDDEGMSYMGVTLWPRTTTSASVWNIFIDTVYSSFRVSYTCTWTTITVKHPDGSSTADRTSAKVLRNSSDKDAKLCPNDEVRAELFYSTVWRRG